MIFLILLVPDFFSEESYFKTLSSGEYIRYLKLRRKKKDPFSFSKKWEYLNFSIKTYELSGGYLY